MRDRGAGVQIMTTSKTFQELVQSFEGVRLVAYQDIKGIWTIGYGHTKDVTPGMTITQATALGLLAYDAGAASNCVNFCICNKGIELTQDEFDALVDFCFNLGCGELQRSAMLKYIIQGRFQAAAGEFEKYDHASGKVVAGLLRRRMAEENLFKGIEPIAIT